MNSKLKYAVLNLAIIALITSCKDDINTPNYGSGGAAGTSVSLKASSSVTIGMSTAYDPVLNQSDYVQTLAANAGQTTFEYAMTNGAILQNDGTLNFSMADRQMQAVKNAGLTVWGHALCWYKNQNAGYIKVVCGLADPPNVMADANPDFEEWTTNSSNLAIPTGWVYANGINDNGSYGTVAQEQATANVNHGKSSMAVTIKQTVTSIGSSWHLQIVSPAFNTVAGHEYVVTYYAKASDATCKLQVEWDHNGTAKYGGTNGATDYGLTTAWKKYTFNFGNGGFNNGSNPAGTGAATTICFDMAYSPVGTTVWIDNMVIVDKTQATLDADPVAQVAKVDIEFGKWVNSAVSHFKGQVVGWDIINELFADDGKIRDNANSPAGSATDQFVWSQYLGKAVGVKAVKLARAADPSALLFINEYGIEGSTPTSMQKLDSLLAYVQWLQDQGAALDGIGTQLHVSISTPKAGLDYMFQKLAATGLKIRISELDVVCNNVKGFSLTPEVLNFQAQTYNDVVSSYMQNVPAAQRQDITIWGVNDPNSWLYKNGTDFPLLFDENYKTKPAFNGFLEGLKAK